MGPEIRVRIGYDTDNVYISSDDKEFSTEYEAMIHEKPIARARYYNKKMLNRSLIKRLFNINPSMKFYDSIVR